MAVNVTRLQKDLIRWFSKKKRLLPWRLRGNPYRIFVVEVMLQQTQMKTVIPYYERWLKAFPNVGALARAKIDRVLKLWEGLGYYTRARNLHAAAKKIVHNFKGRIPSDPETLETLPGIGRYTAGAISSIAYQKRVPLVDGNVARVFSRIFYLKDDISKPETLKKFYRLAETLVPEHRPGDFNQALMELGSLVCTPEAPKCHVCPVRRLCIAYAKGNPEALPIKSNGVKVKKIKMAVGLLEQNGKLLIRRRESRGIWGGLWEIPSVTHPHSERSEQAIQEEFRNSFHVAVEIGEKLKPLKHKFTHRLASIQPFRLTTTSARANTLKGNGFRWASTNALKKLSFPRPHRKILERAHLTQSPEQRPI